MEKIPFFNRPTFEKVMQKVIVKLYLNAFDHKWKLLHGKLSKHKKNSNFLIFDH